MYPEILRIGDFVISSFGVMVAVAFLAAYWVASKEFKRKGLPEDLLGNILISAMVGGILGAKILYIVENVSLQEFMSNPLQYLLSRGGLTFYGGFIVAIVLVIIVARRYRVDFWELGDALAPSLALGYAIGRIACFLVGDDYGTPTNLPWGMSFPKGLPPTTDTVHPTQLYETLIMGLIFAYLWSIRKRNYKTGYLFSLYLILAGTERFMIEFLRNTTPSPISELSLAQLTAALLIIIGTAKMMKLKHRENPSNPSGSQP